MSAVRLAIIVLAAMLIGCSQDPKYLATNVYETGGYWGTQDDRDFDGYDNIRFFLRAREDVVPGTPTITFLVSGLARDTLPPVVLHFERATLDDGHAVWHPVSGGVSTALTGTANPLNGQTLWDAAAVTFINKPAWHWGSLITPDVRQALEGQGDLVLSFPASVPNPGVSPFGNGAKVPAMREVMVQFVWRRRQKPGEQRFKFYQG